MMLRGIMRIMRIVTAQCRMMLRRQGVTVAFSTDSHHVRSGQFAVALEAVNRGGHGAFPVGAFGV